MVVIGCIIPIARKWLNKLGLEQDDLVRMYLREALVNGIGFAMEAAQKRYAGPLTMKIRSSISQSAYDYVVSRVPDAVKHFKLDEPAIRALIEARMPLVPPASDKIGGTLVQPSIVSVPPNPGERF